MKCIQNLLTQKLFSGQLCFPEKIALTSNVSLSLICKTSTKKNSILWSMASQWFTFQRADVHEPPSKLPSSPSPGKVSPEASSHVEKAQPDYLFIYPPLEVWAYDNDCLILGAVASCHTAVGVLYVWYRNGSLYKQGNKLSCIAIREPGLYSMERRGIFRNLSIYVQFQMKRRFLPQTQWMGNKVALQPILKRVLACSGGKRRGGKRRDLILH